MGMPPQTQPDPTKTSEYGDGIKNNEYFKYWTGSEDREKSVVDYVRQTRDGIQAARQQRELLWLECYRVYRQIHANNSYSGRSKIYLPSGFVAVETISPRILLGLLGSEPYIKLAPRKNATEERAYKLSKLLQLQAEQADFFWQFLLFVKQQGIYGRGIGKIWWDRRYKKVVRKGIVPSIRQNEFGQPEVYSELGPVQQNDLLFDGPRFRTVDPFRFYEDATAPSLDEGTCQIERVIKSAYSLKDGEKAGYYGNLDGIDALSTTSNNLYSQNEIARMTASGVNVANIWDSEKKYDVSEYWGLFDINDDGEKEECKITILGDKRIICIEENPYWHNSRPYISCPYVPVDQELDGIGILEPVRTQIYEANDTHNQIMDNKTLILNSMWLVNTNAGVSEGDLRSRPGGIVRTRDMAGVAPLRPPDMTAAGYNAFALLERMIKEGTGAQDPLIGSPSAGTQTATEFNGLMNEANIRIKLIVKLLEQRALIPIFKKWLSMDEQIMNRNVYMQAVENGKPMDLIITPNDVYGDYDFAPQGRLQMDEEAIKNNQRISAFNYTAKYAPQIVPYILAKIWEPIDTKVSLELEKLFAQNPMLMGGMVPGQTGPMAGPGNITTQGQLLAQNSSQNGGA